MQDVFIFKCTTFSKYKKKNRLYKWILLFLNA